MEDCLTESKLSSVKILGRNLKDFHELTHDLLGKSKTSKINPIFEFK